MCLKIYVFNFSHSLTTALFISNTEVTVTNTEESSEVEEDAVVSGLERIRSKC